MSLAEINEPLVLADGTKIDPSNGKVLRDKKSSGLVLIPSASEAQAIVAKTRRSVAELPVAPQQMSTIGLVLFYTMYGLANADIGIITGLSTEQVKTIKALPEYANASADIVKTVRENEASTIRDFFQQKAADAAEAVVEAMEEGGVLGFKAAQDILDRAGHRPADVVEHKHTMQNALRIEHIRATDSKDIPMINVTPGGF